MGKVLLAFAFCGGCAAPVVDDAVRKVGGDLDWCAVAPSCDVPRSDFVGTNVWRHNDSRDVAEDGEARHRGRDLIQAADGPQWAVARMEYGHFRDVLKDEAVDIYLLRNCADWEYLGTELTSADESVESIDGVSDDGGRVFFRIPEEQHLGPGWHRFLFVVQADGTSVDAWTFVPSGEQPYIVTDVDGTLTSREMAATLSVVLDLETGAQPDAARALQAMAARGYLIVYLTARPEWLAAETHEWLTSQGFPMGIVHTMHSGLPAIGNAAADFKRSELNQIASATLRAPEIAIGNTGSDSRAYATADAPAAISLMYRYDDDEWGALRFDSYASLANAATALPDLCSP